MLVVEDSKFEGNEATSGGAGFFESSGGSAQVFENNDEIITWQTIAPSFSTQQVLRLLFIA
jgi:hypothetical protein